MSGVPTNILLTYEYHALFITAFQLVCAAMRSSRLSTEPSTTVRLEMEENRAWSLLKREKLDASLSSCMVSAKVGAFKNSGLASAVTSLHSNQVSACKTFLMFTYACKGCRAT